MPFHLKLDRLLTDADRAELKQLIATPGTYCKDVVAWVRGRGYAVGQAAVAHYVRRERAGTSRPPQRASKLDRVLTPEDQAAMEALAALPSTTINTLHDALQGRGYEVSRGAAGTQLRRWRAAINEVKRCANFARALADVSKKTGAATFSGGAVLGLEQVILERLFQVRHGNLDPKALTDWAGLLERSIGVRNQHERLRRKSQGADKPGGAGPGKGGEASARPRVVNGVEIANCVRRILGVPLPGEPVPEPPRLEPPVELEAPGQSPNDETRMTNE